MTTLTHSVRNLSMALALLGVPAAVMAADAGDPTSRINAYDEAVIVIAKAKLPLSSRTDRFEAVVKSYYDMPTIAALVVGSTWASASSAEKTSAITALTRHSAISLAKNFKDYDGTPFKADPKPIVRNGAQVVKVTIGSDTLFYRMRQAGGGWKIVDVISGGVSQLALQRADLATTVQAGGISGMVKKLGQLDAAAK